MEADPAQKTNWFDFSRTEISELIQISGIPTDICQMQTVLDVIIRNNRFFKVYDELLVETEAEIAQECFVTTPLGEVISGGYDGSVEIDLGSMLTRVQFNVFLAGLRMASSYFSHFEDGDLNCWEYSTKLDKLSVRSQNMLVKSPI